jgi:hypothetical protein
MKGDKQHQKRVTYPIPVTKADAQKDLTLFE